MKKILSICCLVALMSCSIQVTAQDFSATTPSNHMLDYKITSSTSPYTVMVVGGNNITGHLIIPDTVSYNGITYVVDEIDTMAFEYANYSQLTIPRTVTKIPFISCLSNFSLINFNVDTANPRFRSYEGVLYTRDLDTLWDYPAGNPASHYEIPNTVTNIGIGAFFYRQHIDRAVIPNSVRTIENYAFTGTFIKTLIIGASVDTLKHFSFGQTDSLSDIICLSSNPPGINYYAFLSFEPMQRTFYIPCGSMSEYRTMFYRNFMSMPSIYTLVEDCDEHSITIDPDIYGGTVTASTNSARLGDSVAITITPNPGMSASFLAVVKTSDQSYIVAHSIDTFIMPSFDVTITALFAGNNGISEAHKTNANIFGRNGNIVIEGAGNERVVITDMLGRIIYNSKVGEMKVVAMPKSGIYIVKVGNQQAVKVPVVR
ncbi:MAG: leucine-rich repeat protein [Bacteroidales bacterium]|nr:leucine-rich repeat protein [Bacteroidales bacterium]